MLCEAASKAAKHNKKMLKLFETIVIANLILLDIILAAGIFFEKDIEKEKGVFPIIDITK